MATGKHAKGQCQRCSFVYKLTELVEDGETSLLVCKACYDMPHPAKQPFDATDDPTLSHPAPDLDPAQTTPTSLASALGLASGTYFGGST